LSQTNSSKIKFFKKLLLFGALTVFACNCNLAFAMEKIFYLERGDNPTLEDYDYSLNALKSIESHKEHIDILSPMAYQVDQNGTVWGEIDSRFLAAAKQYNIKLMPLITNAGFDVANTHQFLQNIIAQQRAIDNLIQIAKTNKYYGMQLDFELIHIEDKQAFTDFFKKLAQAFHANNLVISVAILPRSSDDGGTSDFTKAVFDASAGAYDYSVLGKYSDFVTLMAYNQHGGGTIPGPVAEIPWVEAIIKYALKYIPPEKISLGVPVYSTYWFTTFDNGIHVVDKGINYAMAKNLAAKFQSTWYWDNFSKTYFTFFNADQLNQYIFMEDARSFKEKLALVNQYKLRGISVWVLGYEDPAIWQQF